MLKFASTTISDGDQRVGSDLHLFTSNSHCNILPLAFRKVSLNGENRSTRSTADRWMDAQDVCSQSNKS